MDTFTHGAEWFIDQYGYIYRYEPDATGKHSVTVANWQPNNGVPRGDVNEAVRLVKAANAAPDLYAALQSCESFIAELASMNRVPPNVAALREARAALAKVNA